MHVYGYKGRGREGNQSVHGKEALVFSPAKPIDDIYISAPQHIDIFISPPQHIDIFISAPHHIDIFISAPQHIQPKKIIIAI